MFKPPFLKLPLIALALASYVSGSAQATPAQNSPAFDRPAVICVLPGSQEPRLAHSAGGNQEEPHEQRIKLAHGQKPLTVCPPGATTYIDFGYSPGRFPDCPQCPPPGDAASIEMQLNKDAQMQLDAIAASKLRNKTPALQTSGQPP